MRAAGLIRQILDFSRRSTPKVEPVDLRALLGEAVKLLDRTLPATIRIVTDTTAGQYRVKADATQLSQVLANLALNARDAMPDGGSLTFTTQCVDSASLQGLGEAIESRYVCIEVNDMGMGMDENVRKRIFEPFFTTKDIGKGTGPGLSVVYGIVKSHNGLINF